MKLSADKNLFSRKGYNVIQPNLVEHLYDMYDKYMFE